MSNKSSGRKNNQEGTPTIVNRKARHNYNILDTIEAGVVLRGNEIKSIRDGSINIRESYAKVINGEVWLVGCHISPYKNQNTFDTYNPLRNRKLLFSRHEINKLVQAVQEKGLTLVPLKIYFRRGRAKLEIGIGRGKNTYDKRQDLKGKDAKREMERALKN
ncbi:MAG TPA: SsrA-binding protein SmpB [Nitrospinota bacterium]|jgi:SsrA-binding protein|nr:SsrA-binding protein SmpB [Nitrospinota bacterium]|tara:strand:- start:31217 stop:31699 length:483 start_codon:yes stop_codon:yes gene_type:complete